MVEASVTARLLRWKLLTIDASVLLLPAPPANGETVSPPPDAWRLNAAKRKGLADAIEKLDQVDHDLARARDRRGVSSSAFA